MDEPPIPSYVEDTVLSALKCYTSIRFSPQPGKFTIFASFALYDLSSRETKVASMGTGSKCLPISHYSAEGDALHDSHAEVLARRGLVRWLMEEVCRDSEQYSITGRVASRWLAKDGDGKYFLRRNVRLHLYVSTVPCGDGSTRLLAALQDPAMAELKNSSPWPELKPDTPSRGRDDYSRIGVLRTKPGRGDAPPVLSMSCSDKVARWNVLGVQGALASRVLAYPIYIDSVIIGDVPVATRELVREDCERAFWRRLGDIPDLPAGYHVAHPSVFFTNQLFPHSHTGMPELKSSSNDSLCWVADSSTKFDVLINGLRRGVSPKHRMNEKFRPGLSKVALFGLFYKAALFIGLNIANEQSYFLTKEQASAYGAAKNALVRPNGPFSGWLCSGVKWENFRVRKLPLEAHEHFTSSVSP